jgi:hypothetical protein
MPNFRGFCSKQTLGRFALDCLAIAVIIFQSGSIGAGYRHGVVAGSRLFKVYPITILIHATRLYEEQIQEESITECITTGFMVSL